MASSPPAQEPVWNWSLSASFLFVDLYFFFPFLSFLFFSFLSLFFGHTANGTGCQSRIQSVSLISSSLRTLVQQASSHDNNRSSLSPFLPLIRILHSHHFLIQASTFTRPSNRTPWYPKATPRTLRSPFPFPNPGHQNETNHTNCTSQSATIWQRRNFLLFFELDWCLLASWLFASQELIYMEHRVHHFPLLNGDAQKTATPWDHIDR